MEENFERYSSLATIDPDLDDDDRFVQHHEHENVLDLMTISAELPPKHNADFVDKLKKTENNEIRRRLLHNLTAFLNEGKHNLGKIQLRPHQIYALTRLEDALQDDTFERGYFAHPTGAGKTILFMSVMHATQAKKSLIIVPTIQLANQTISAIKKNLPDKKISYVFSNIDEQHNDIVSGYDGEVVIMVRNSFVYKNEERNVDRAHDLSKEKFDLIICDEAHNYLSKNFQDALSQQQGLILGMSATPDYLYLKKIRAGHEDYREFICKKSIGDYFGQEIDQISLEEAMKRGILAPATAMAVKVKNLDYSEVEITGGDFNQKSLNEFFSREQNWAMIKEAALNVFQNGLRYGDKHISINNKKVFIVCSNIEQATNFEEELRSRNIKAESVTSQTPKKNNSNSILSVSQVYERYKKDVHDDDAINVLLSVDMLKEGWDEPMAEVCIFLRPTISYVLYKQVVGRVLRLNPDNKNKVAMVIDFHAEKNGQGVSQINPVEVFGEVNLTNIEKVADENKNGNEHQRQQSASGALIDDNFILSAEIIDYNDFGTKPKSMEKLGPEMIRFDDCIYLSRKEINRIYGLKNNSNINHLAFDYNGKYFFPVEKLERYILSSTNAHKNDLAVGGQVAEKAIKKTILNKEFFSKALFYIKQIVKNQDYNPLAEEMKMWINEDQKISDYQLENRLSYQLLIPYIERQINIVHQKISDQIAAAQSGQQTPLFDLPGIMEEDYQAIVVKGEQCRREKEEAIKIEQQQAEARRKEEENKKQQIAEEKQGLNKFIGSIKEYHLMSERKEMGWMMIRLEEREVEIDGHKQQYFVKNVLDGSKHLVKKIVLEKNSYQPELAGGADGAVYFVKKTGRTAKDSLNPKIKIEFVTIEKGSPILELAPKGYEWEQWPVKEIFY